MKVILFLIFFIQVIQAKEITSLNLTNLNGDKVNIAIEDKKILLFFWATWCSECKTKLKNELLTFEKDSSLIVHTINIDSNLKRAKHFIKKQKLKNSILRDEKRDLINFLGIEAVPFWVILKPNKRDKNFTLIKSQTGFNMKSVQKFISSF